MINIARMVNLNSGFTKVASKCEAVSKALLGYDDLIAKQASSLIDDLQSKVAELEKRAMITETLLDLKEAGAIDDSEVMSKIAEFELKSVDDISNYGVKVASELKNLFGETAPSSKIKGNLTDHFGQKLSRR